MGLETVTYINDFVQTNPVGASDPKSEGDDHIRNIKKGLQNTFPGLAGRAWRSQSKAAGYTVAATDNMTMLNCTAALTLAITAAATLGNGFMFAVNANGGAVTIDPNSTETINGSATMTVEDGLMALVFCDGSAFYAIKFGRNGSEFATGTLMLFQQTSAPTGWTKQTTHNDKSLRVVSGSAGSGGATAFTSVFGASKVTGGHSITQAELPNCSFTVTDPGHTHSYQHGQGNVSGSTASGWGGGVIGNYTTGSATTGITVGSGGSGTAHTHTLSLDLQYVDVIIASKA